MLNTSKVVLTVQFVSTPNTGNWITSRSSIKDKGIVNIEMECTAISFLCYHTNIKCAVVCVTLSNRLKGDQVDILPEDYKAWSLRPQKLVAKFFKSDLTKAAGN